MTQVNLSGISLDDTVAVTAYDSGVDGTNDQIDGNESWFSYADAILTYYVSNDGDNNNSGFLGNPFSSIQVAINASKNKDTVYVYNGLYNENINFKIGCYSNNIMKIMSGMGGLAYDFSHIISTALSTVSQPATATSTWSTETKPLEGDDDCPVLKDKIEGDYIVCHQCKKNFDASVKEFWIDTHHKCPMCRTQWENKIIYSQPTNE